MGAFAAGLVFIVSGNDHGTNVAGDRRLGAVMAVLMLFAIHYPRHCIYIMGLTHRSPLDRRDLFDLRFVSGPFGMGGNVPTDNVAHAAHLGGLLFGYLYYKFQWRFERLFRNFKLPDMKSSSSRSGLISRGNLKLNEPPENIDAKVDEILQKISRSGEASLTDQERKVLKPASRRYKKCP